MFKTVMFLETVSISGAFSDKLAYDNVPLVRHHLLLTAKKSSGSHGRNHVIKCSETKDGCTFKTKAGLVMTCYDTFPSLLA